jgi:hypothetical protein
VVGFCCDSNKSVSLTPMNSGHTSTAQGISRNVAIIQARDCLALIENSEENTAFLVKKLINL